MRVLVTESKAGAAAPVRTELVLRGHQVLSCHPDSGDDFHCTAINAGGTCPLDLGLVDVLVDVRDEDYQFTTREYGVVCARRVDVPIVIAGPTRPTSAGVPLDKVAVQCAPRDVADAVESAAALPDAAALHSLRIAIRDVLRRRTGEQRALVSVIDHGFYVDVVVRSPATPDRAARAELEHAIRQALRDHRSDWVHARLVYRHTPMPDPTPYNG
jgi:hypothetical protein